MLDEVDIIDFGWSAIESLDYRKLPKKVKEIYARCCGNLKNIDLSGCEVDRIDVRWSGIKRIKVENMLKKLSELMVDVVSRNYFLSIS